MNRATSLRKIVPFPTASETSIQTILVVLGTGAIVLVLALHLLFLTSYPPIFIDEGWNANATWNWVQTGVNLDPMHAEALNQFGYGWILRDFLGQLPWYAAFSTLGLGLFQARLVSWFFGVILVGLTVIVGRRLYGIRTGIVAGLLLSLSVPFLEASHYARPDIMLAVFMLLAFLLALIALETNRWWLHVVTGLVVGASLDIHENALQFVPALAALYLVFYGKAFYRKRGVWLVGVGGALGVAVYAILHVLPSPEMFSRLMGVYMGGAGENQLPLFNPAALAASAVGELGRYRFFDHGLDFVLIGASILYLLYRRSQSDRLLLAYALAGLLSSVLLIGNKSPLYAILLYPYFMLMAAASLVSIITEVPLLSKQQVFVGAVLVFLIGNNAIHIARPMLSNRAYDYYAITERIESVIPPGARVMGLPQWWLGLAEYDYRSSLNLTFYRALNDYSLNEAMEVIHPDILILDGALASLMVNEGESLDIAQDLYKLPREDFMDFLAERGEKLLEFTDPWHGEFEIYAIHWDSES